MFTEQEHYTCVSTSIRIADFQSAADHRLHQTENTAPEFENSGRLFSLVVNAPTTFAERFPRLMVGAVAVAVLLAALTAEIDCLHNSGYFWQ